MTKKTTTQEESPVAKPKVSDFIGKKLVDASNENGETKLHFSNGYVLKVKGNISFVVE